MTGQKFLLRLANMFPHWEWSRIRALLEEVNILMDKTCTDQKCTPTDEPVDFSKESQKEP